MKNIFLLTAIALLSVTTAAGESIWHNPLKETVAGTTNIHNQAWNEDGGNYRRLPQRAEKNVRPKLWNLSTNSAGMQIRFLTNSPDIAVRYKVTGPMAMPHMPATGVSGVDLYRTDDGGFCFGTYSFGDSTVQYAYRIDRPESKSPERFTLYLPLFNEVKELEIGVNQDSSFEFIPASAEKPIVVYGTSITHGACASRPAMAWTNILQRRSGVPVVNLGFSGNGMLEPELIALVNEIDSRAVVLDCMPNLFQVENRELTQLVENAVMQIRAKSDVPILLVEHAGYSNMATNQGKHNDYTNANTAQRTAYANLLKKGVKNLHYLSSEDIAMPEDAWVDYVHPSDLGQNHHAEAVRKALGKFLPQMRKH